MRKNGRLLRKNESHSMKMRINKLPLALILLGALALSVPASADNPRVSSRGNFGMDPEVMPISYEFYNIEGQTMADLYKQMQKLGPVGFDGTKGFGLTEWRVQWGIQFRFNQHKVCTQFKTRVTGAIKFTMPQWTGYSEASLKTKKEWDDFYKKLQIHEDGHALHGASALKEVSQLNPKPNSSATCESIQKDFSAKTSQIIKKYNQKDIDYDRKTQHGINP